MSRARAIRIMRIVPPRAPNDIRTRHARRAHNGVRCLPNAHTHIASGPTPLSHAAIDRGISRRLAAPPRSSGLRAAWGRGGGSDERRLKTTALTCVSHARALVREWFIEGTTT
jgi:hypothetical protein